MFVSGFCFGSLTPPCPPLRGGNLPDESTLHICGSASLRVFPLCKGGQGGFQRHASPQLPTGTKKSKTEPFALPWITHTQKLGMEIYPPRNLLIIN